jgi:hypothetical protein
MMMIGFAAMAIAQIIVFAIHHCAQLQCGAIQNKTPVIVAGVLL